MNDAEAALSSGATDEALSLAESARELGDDGLFQQVRVLAWTHQREYRKAIVVLT